MLKEIYGIPVNPSAIAALPIERSRGAGRKYHVQFHTVSGYNFTVSDDFETREEAEAVRKDIAATLGLEISPDQFEEQKRKLEELIDYTGKIEKENKNLKGTLESERAEAEKNITGLSDQVKQLSEDKAALESEVADLGAEITQMEQLKKDKAMLEQEVAELKKNKKAK
jgi:DNA repair exonuclease SbcCD ATPase subunit